MTQASRDEFWDASKAALMYLVVLGHAIQIIVGEGFFSHPLFKAIYLFHLPVFFFISGYFAYSSIIKRGRSALGRAALRLLTPVFTIGSCEAIMYIVYQHSFSWSSFLGCYVLCWFLWCLFACHILGHVTALFTHPIWKTICFLVPIVPCILFPNSIPYANYLSYAWFFFALGIFAKSRNFNSGHINRNWLWAIFPACLMFIFFKDDWYIYLCPQRGPLESAGIALFRFIAALFSGAFFLALMHQCAAWLRIAKIGSATLGIFILQSFACAYASKLEYPPFCTQTWFICGVSLLVFLIAYYIYVLTKRLPLVGFLLYGNLPTNESAATRK